MDNTGVSLGGVSPTLKLQSKAIESALRAVLTSTPRPSSLQFASANTLLLLTVGGQQFSFSFNLLTKAEQKLLQHLFKDKKHLNSKSSLSGKNVLIEVISDEKANSPQHNCNANRESKIKLALLPGQLAKASATNTSQASSVNSTGAKPADITTTTFTTKSGAKPNQGLNSRPPLTYSMKSLNQGSGKAFAQPPSQPSTAPIADGHTANHLGEQKATNSTPNTPSTTHTKSESKTKASFEQNVDVKSQLARTINELAPDEKLRLQEKIAENISKISSTLPNPESKKLAAQLQGFVAQNTKINLSPQGLAQAITAEDKSALVDAEITSASSGTKTTPSTEPKPQQPTQIQNQSFDQPLHQSLALMLAASQAGGAVSAISAAKGGSDSIPLLLTLLNILRPAVARKSLSIKSGVKTAISGEINAVSQLLTNFKQLRSFTETLKQNQLSISKFAQGETSADKNLYLTFPLSNLNESGAEILITRDEKNQTRKANSHQTWYFQLKLNVGNLGQLLAKITWLKDMNTSGTVDMAIYGGTEAVYQKIQQFSPLLKERMSKLGFNFNQLEMKIADIPETLKPLLNQEVEINHQSANSKAANLATANLGASHER